MNKLLSRLFRFAALVAVLISPSGRTLAAAPTPPATQAQAGDTLVILDASGSMNERIRGETKMVIARRAVRELVESLPANTRLGLVAYSHRRNACDDIELLIPPGPLDKTAFIAAVDALTPNGRTPVAASMEFAAQALNYTKIKANIILVSDGEETCGGDPCATARALNEKAAGLIIHAVAFDLTARQAKAFACVAATTKGRFLQANDAATLKDALVVAVTESTAVAKTQPAAEDLSPATITLPAEVRAGADFQAGWKGPNNPGDYLCIVPAGAPDDEYENTNYTRQGSPLAMTALLDAGKAEVRYVAGRSRKILGRAAIVITPISVTLQAPAEAVAGGPLQISWDGPSNRGDYITIVQKSAADTAAGKYVETSKGSPVKATTPIQAGDAEIRYISGQGRKVLARRALQIVPAKVTLDAPAEATAGSPLEVVWTGPNHDDDFIAIMPKSAADTAWRRPVATRHGSPAKLTAPIESGEAEVRYYSGEGYQVLARRPIKVLTAEVTLDAAAEALPGSEVSVTWTGPNNENDFIAIVAKSAADGAWKRVAYTRNGSPVKVTAPIEPGDAEIRYLSGTGHKVLARRPIKLSAATITFDAPERVVAGSMVAVNWTGPNLNNDFLVIMPKSAADGAWKRTAYTRGGSPAKVMAPLDPGEAEIRYLSGEGHKVLARRPITVVAAEITLKAPDEVVAASEVTVEWTGPNNDNDFMVIMPKSASDGSWRTTSYTRKGSPTKVLAPTEPGPSELRYLSGTEHRVLARRPILVKAAEVSLSAPDAAAAGAVVSVEWSGPNNSNDFIAIVPKDAKTPANGRPGYTRNGSPVKVTAPSAAGPAEVRYVNGGDNRVLARKDITLTAP